MSAATTFRARLLPFGLTGAVALALLAGASFSGDLVAKPSPDRTVAAAQAALAKGQVDRAISLAEAAVAKNLREPSYRALLGQAYLRAGRFTAAATTLDDALTLGDESARTALGLALAYAGAGRSADALTVLEDWRDAIPAADLGLALSLAGQPERGAALLAAALRAGENTPKLRQNLAYAYALAGRWREARLMMSQDVPAGQIEGRISDCVSPACLAHRCAAIRASPRVLHWGPSRRARTLPWPLPSRSQSPPPGQCPPPGWTRSRNCPRWPKPSRRLPPILLRPSPLRRPRRARRPRPPPA